MSPPPPNADSRILGTALDGDGKFDHNALCELEAFCSVGKPSPCPTVAAKKPLTPARDAELRKCLGRHNRCPELLKCLGAPVVKTVQRKPTVVRPVVGASGVLDIAELCQVQAACTGGDARACERYVRANPPRRGELRRLSACVQPGSECSDIIRCLRLGKVDMERADPIALWLNRNGGDHTGRQLIQAVKELERRACACKTLACIPEVQSGLMALSKLAGTAHVSARGKATVEASLKRLTDCIVKAAQSTQ